MKAVSCALLLAIGLAGCAAVKEAAAPPPAPPPRPIPVPRAVPPPPLPVLSPQGSSEDEQRVRRQAQDRIDGTERLVRRIDETKLAEDQAQNFVTIQSFLVKAREALSARDVQRAFTLADKAYLLADELSRTAR